MKKKSKSIILIIILSIIILCLIGFMLIVMRKNLFTIGKTELFNNIYEKEYNNIKIDMDYGEIYVLKSNDGKFKVIVYGTKGNYIDVSESENVLSVNTNAKECNFICFNRSGNRVEVYVPEQYSNEINVNNDVGNINVDEFNFSTINIKESLGNVKVKGAHKATITNEFGDIELSKANVAYIKANAGNINIDTVNDVQSKNDLGNTIIKQVNNFMDVENDCGNIEIDEVNINENSKIKNNLGNIGINSTNEIYIDAENSLGNINIKNNYKFSNVILKIENDCGNIIVNN